MDLDFMPSPVPERPGLLLRDPYGYSDATLIVPPPLVEALRCFDGEQTELDLRQELTKITGDFQVSDLLKHLCSTLDLAGFLQTTSFEEMRAKRHREFADSPQRDAAHAGSAYPNDKDELQELFDDYLSEPESDADATASLTGIAAPHVSPEGGWQCYREAFGALPREASDRVFIVLGTSHYGEPERFGLTRKSYLTPYGEAPTETAWVDELARKAGRAVIMEDYCHAFEHSIEFQIVFLQTLFGPAVRVLPVLCGAFAKSIYTGGMPEDAEPVRAFLDGLAELAERERGRACFVLGVDMAHMGKRYGDRDEALAGQGWMQEVAARDQARLECLTRCDADGFWRLVQENHDDLKWCGSAPIYTFLRAARPTAGRLRRYQQWNIDEQSVVTFAAMSFRNS